MVGYKYIQVQCPYFNKANFQEKFNILKKVKKPKKFEEQVDVIFEGTETKAIYDF